MVISRQIFLISISVLLLSIESSVTIYQNYDDQFSKNLMVFASTQENEDDSNKLDQSNEISNKYFEQDDTGDELPNLPNSSGLDEAITGQDSLSQQGSELNTYESQNFGFKIGYPISWQETENTGSNSAHAVVFISPFEDNLDKFNERLAVRISVVDSNTTLTGYSDTYIGNIRNNADSEVIEITNSSLSGNPAEKLVYILRQGEKQFGILEQWTVWDNKVYQISFYGEQEKYQSYLPMIEELINSFEIF